MVELKKEPSAGSVESADRDNWRQNPGTLYQGYQGPLRGPWYTKIYNPLLTKKFLGLQLGRHEQTEEKKKQRNWPT